MPELSLSFSYIFKTGFQFLMKIRTSFQFDQNFFRDISMTISCFFVKKSMVVPCAAWKPPWILELGVAFGVELGMTSKKNTYKFLPPLLADILLVNRNMRFFQIFRTNITQLLSP